MSMNFKVWDSERSIGYKQITTFFMDFSIADNFGVKEIKDTYKRAFKEWKSNYKYLTELVMVLNAKCWQHYYEQNFDKATLYEELFYEARNYACDNLKGEELTYFIRTTD